MKYDGCSLYRRIDCNSPTAAAVFVLLYSLNCCCFVALCIGAHPVLYRPGITAPLPCETQLHRLSLCTDNLPVAQQLYHELHFSLCTLKGPVSSQVIKQARYVPTPGIHNCTQVDMYMHGGVCIE